MVTLKSKLIKNNTIKNKSDELIEKHINYKKEKKIQKQIENSKIILESERKLKNIL